MLQGLDVAATRVRLEEWILESHAFRWSNRNFAWPAGRSPAVFELAWSHACEHSFAALWHLEDDTWMTACRCVERPCRVAGVAFALIALDIFQRELAAATLLNAYLLEDLAKNFEDVNLPGIELRVTARVLRGNLR